MYDTYFSRHIICLTDEYLFIKTKQLLLHLNGHFIGFNLIYWIALCGKYFLECSILEKCGKIWLDWGNTARADMAGLGSIGLNYSVASATNGDLKRHPPAECVLLIMIRLWIGWCQCPMSEKDMLHFLIAYFS